MKKKHIALMCAVISVVAAVAAVAIWLSGMQFRTVLTTSMEPAIPRGRVVVVSQRVSAAEIEVDDIVTFIRDQHGTIITHRVVEIETCEYLSFWFTTQGDNNQFPDAPFPAPHLIGRVRTTLPGWPFFWHRFF